MDGPPLVLLALGLGVLAALVAVMGTWRPTQAPNVDPLRAARRGADELRNAADALDRAAKSLAAALYSDQATETARAAARARRAAAAVDALGG